jgi:hypothetical protein
LFVGKFYRYMVIWLLITMISLVASSLIRFIH